MSTPTFANNGSTRDWRASPRLFIGARARSLLLLWLAASAVVVLVRLLSPIPASALAPAQANAAVTTSFAAPPPAGVDAKAIYVFDSTTNTALYALHPDERRAPASLTKIATALVVLGRAELDDEVTIRPEDVVDTSQSRVELVPGDTLKVRDLLRGLLIQSGNDAALALARHVGATLPRGDAVGGDPISAFVAEMNRLVKDLGLANTQFVNPMGLDHDDQFSSARDIALLTARAMRDATFAEIVATPKATLQSTVRPEGYTVFTTNDLLLEGLVQGVKTGSTSKAGGCLVTVSKMGENEVIAVVLGSPIEYDDEGFPHSPARFGSVRTMLATIPNDFQWVDPGEAGLVDGLAEELAVWEAALPAGPSIVIPVARADELRYRLQLGPPGEPNQEIGKVLFFVGSELLSERPVLQAPSYPDPGLVESDGVSGSI